jgi:hypothetical protein
MPAAMVEAATSAIVAALIEVRSGIISSLQIFLRPHAVRKQTPFSKR